MEAGLWGSGPAKRFNSDRTLAKIITMIAALLTLLALLAPKQHIAVTATASPTTARAGAKVSLFVDVVPDAGIHVYAPGAKDYQPIAIAIEPRAEMTAGRIVYPKSEMLSFDGESVPVFQKPFRLTQDVTLAKSAKPGTKLTVVGKVDYQACDDKVCFIPASLPVSWTIGVK
jgi:DsbC/DsbD-like thiol-disulfide interchange protein